MSTYKKWELIRTEQFDDYKSTGLFYRHTKTGMEVFHLLNDDEENLFAFGFKTLNPTSDGAAHVLEHSVLCGSKRYPLKDPFMQLNSQSVKTFLNAMTFPDKTLYPAASMVKADYFNLMAVYGDAVFNPLLLKETFAQEAHRFEADETGRISIQGVVYNEMKGAYSSFDSIVSDCVIRYAFPGTPYAFDSGGDPVHIPDLTLDKLRAFHAEHYSPAKCRLFLYGNIPTETQLDFIEDRFLSGSLQEGAKSPDASEAHRSAKTLSSSERSLYECSFDEPRFVEVSGPACGGETGATVLLNWVFGPSSDMNEYMEAGILSELLMGHDASPLTKALVDSGLGEDTSPNNGLETELARLILSCGMRGVKKRNAHKIEDCIMKVLNDIAASGFDSSDIKAALMSVDFSLREVQRSSGPWSLVLMRRAFRGWLRGSDPFSALETRAAFEKVKQKIKAPDGNEYLKNLVKRFLIDNPHRLLLSVVPDKSYDKQREKAYKAQNASCKRSLDELQKEQKELQTYQQKNDEELRSLIPHLKPSDLEKKVDIIHTEKTEIAGIPVFVHNETANGIVYINAAVPVDILDAEDYPLLPFYAQVLTNTGFKEMSWTEAAAKIAQITGGFGASVFTSSMSLWAKKHKLAETDPLTGRDWLFLRVKTLAEYAREGIGLLFDCFETPDFFDTKRLHDLALEYRNDFMSSIIPAGHSYAVSRCAASLSRSKTVEEIWSGLSQLYTARALASQDINALSEKLQRIHKRLVGAGLCINITADGEGIREAKDALKPRLSSFKAPALSAGLPIFSESGIKDLPALTCLDGTDESKSSLSVYTAPSETGFAAAAFASSPFGTKESVYETLFAHWFTNNVLWEKIRTIGGAYGAFAYSDALECVFSFATYRDPDPLRSLDTYIDCLHKASRADLSKTVLERAITGCYSKEVQPRSPSSRGFTGFIRALYGIRDEQREEKIETLLSAREKDVRNAAVFLSERAQKVKRALICGNYTGQDGIVIPLPLYPTTTEL
ncbi:insulinase family protein [Treponema sp.]|uniref:insulinase family protein n=1 Tax=Treponema sp. TaxID=166 RepID=UPI003FA1B1E0